MWRRAAPTIRGYRQGPVHRVHVALGRRTQRPAGTPVAAREATAFWTVTHTRPVEITTPCGLPPTWIVVSRGVAVAASMRVTVPPPTVGDPDRAAADCDADGLAPTGTVFVADRVPGSMRTTLSSSVSATQTAPAPTAMPLGPWPTVIGVSRPVGGRARHGVGREIREPGRIRPDRDRARATFGSTCCSSARFSGRGG